MATSRTRSRKHSALGILVPVAAIVVATAGGLFALSRYANSPPGDGDHTALVQGATIPDFELKLLDGSGKKFSELGARVVMINFWATWCEACVLEMPSIVNLHHSYKDRGFEVIAVNVDENPADVVPKAARELGMDFPIYIDPETRLAELFDVSAIPMTVILDASGKVLLVETGERDWNGTEVRSQMERWLSK